MHNSHNLALGNLNSFADANKNDVVVLAQEEMTVGSVVFRIDSVDPSTLYGGTWELITGDATIEFGDGTSQTGAVIGDNEETVPLPEHAHTASFSGNTLPAHNDTVTMYTSDGTDSSGEQAYSKYADYGSGTVTTNSVSEGTPSGSVTVSKTGVSDAKIDVRGSRVKINVWKRTS